MDIKLRCEKNFKEVNKYKVLIPEAGNPGSTIIGNPRISEPGSCSSNTYIVAIAEKTNLQICKNILSYLKTQFLRFLLSLKTTTQHMPPKAYSFVPLQDFTENSDIDWSKSVAEIDQQLYKKYNLSDEEITFIESMIKPME